MDFLKELFEDGALTFEQLQSKVTERGFKLADLSTGNYVAKKKYEDDVASRDGQIADLSGQIKTRDTDIKALQKQLSDGTTDTETKIADLTEQLTKLQGDYKTAKTAYEEKLSGQAYEFAVREFANSQNFTSSAAKKEFTREMLSARLQMKDSTIIGASDFLAAYKTDNADSFVVEKSPEPETSAEPKPMFVQPTPPTGGEDTNPFNFNFAGVR